MMMMLNCCPVSFSIFSAQRHIYWQAQESNTDDYKTVTFPQWTKMKLKCVENGRCVYSMFGLGYKLSSAPVLCAVCSVQPNVPQPAAGPPRSVYDAAHCSIYSNTPSAGGDHRHAEPQLTRKIVREKWVIRLKNVRGIAWMINKNNILNGHEMGDVGCFWIVVFCLFILMYLFLFCFIFVIEAFLINVFGQKVGKQCSCLTYSLLIFFIYKTSGGGSI